MNASAPTPRALRALVVALLALCGLLGSSCAAERQPVEVSLESPTRPTTSTAAPEAPTGTTDPGASERVFPEDWQAPGLTWAPCAELRRGECATLPVPLDWSDPAGPSIELVIGRLVARGDRIGSLVTNPGGPGGSGLRFLGYDGFDSPIRDRFDLVSWDPRGVGASEGLSCDGSVEDLLSADPDPDSPTEQQQLEDAAQAVATDCSTRHGDLLEHLDTLAVAFDLEAIRRALGDEPLNYLGFSYGTQIGQLYAEHFPEQIRAMVLDGVVDPQLGFEEFLLGQTAAFDAAFRRDAQRCSREPQRCGVEDLAAAYDQVAELVEVTPLQSADGPVGPGELATAAIYTSYGAQGWVRLGPALAAGLAGDGTALRQLADAYIDLAGYPTYAAVVCTDSPPPEGFEQFADFARRAAEVSARFGAAVANEMLPCAVWGAPARTEAAPIRAPGSPPILVVGNTGDAATPYENAVAVADALDAAVLVTAQIEGHTAYGSNRCVTEVVDAYLVDLVVPDADPRCA